MGKRRDPKTDNTDAQQKPWLFKPGQSGNPAADTANQTNRTPWRHTRLNVFRAILPV
jgi:hypothetical protein